MKMALFVALAPFVFLSAIPAQAQMISGTPVIASYHSAGRCLDMRASDRQVLLWNCHGGSNQIFRYVSGSYGMISLGDQRCLTSGLTSKSAITVQPCNNAKNQRWGYQANGTLRNELNLCFDIEGGSTGNGARILAFDCHGGSNQQWYPAVNSKSAYIGIDDASKFGGTSGIKNFVRSANFSGGNIVASGGGNLIANDGASLIANDGASIVAGGAGNMIARFGSGIVAGGAGNIVAGGAGNFIPSNWSFFSGAGAGIVAGGAGN
jgi:Ricin-type beta-trefoil lectin domain